VLHLRTHAQRTDTTSFYASLGHLHDSTPIFTEKRRRSSPHVLPPVADRFPLPKLTLGLVVLFAIFVPLASLFLLMQRKFWQCTGVRTDLAHFFISGGLRKLRVAAARVILT
jgi:hypothetical protein